MACRFLMLLAVVGLGSSLARGDEPLHRRIDQLVAAKMGGTPVPRSDDAEFLRRAYLDFAGRIPPAEETRRFLSDPSPDKRQAVIDQLLAAPAYVQRMANLFHVTLMERRGDHDEWQVFLRGCFAQNKPWDQMVREILQPDRADESLRGAAFFYTRRLEKVGQNPTDYPGLTRDVGRLFLGVDLQCAECHDHLFIDDYKQRDFQGLFAIYKNLSIRNEKFPAVNEATITDKLEFVSVFGATKQRTGPRIPFTEEFAIPELPAEDPAAKKKKKPDPNQPPAFSAIGLLSEALPSAENRLFRQNIANRLWFFMMGRGLVEPLDQFHSGNPATHPELLELLADELARHQFDIKWMLRELALTDTWQRSSRMPVAGDLPPRESYRMGLQRPLTAEQLLWSTLQATGSLDRLAPGGIPSDDCKQLEARFLAAFGGEPLEPAVTYLPAVKQALFLLNDARVLDLLQPHPGSLLHRLTTLPDDQVADELFLSIFCRWPDDAERASVVEHLQRHRDNRDMASRQLAWAMLASVEFCVNH